jgi:hypothetical protein
MDVIRNWEARRSGATQTVEGVNAHGTPVAVTQVESIKGAAYAGPETGHVAMPVATRADGTQYVLV